MKMCRSFRAIGSALGSGLLALALFHAPALGEGNPAINASRGRIEVIAAWNASGATKDVIGLGNYLKVRVAGLDSLLSNPPAPDAELVPYLNGIPMAGIKPLFLNPGDSTVVFRLQRDSASLRSWDMFYQFPIQFQATVKVSVGYPGRGPVPSNCAMRLVLMRKGMLWGSFAGLLALVILIAYLAARTSIIRGDAPGPNRCYSLARTQLAFWTVLIVFAFIYIWAVTGDLPPVNGSILVLLAISMGTAAGASIIDFSQKDNLPAGPSQGFLIDILSDRGGVSIHRFQMFVWTIVLGIFFYRTVLRNLAMPQFDDSLLTLMGISSGAYLGLKIPEGRGEKGTEE